MLRVGEGQTVTAVSVAPLRWGLGIEVLVEGDGLPEPTANLGVHNSAGLAKRALEEWTGIKERREGYTPAKPVVAPSDDARWPKFPGQDLNYIGTPVSGSDPGDEDVHTGGPR